MSARNGRSWAVYGPAASCTPAPSQTAATGLVSCPAMAHCPAASLGGTRALTGHTKQNHPLLLHCRCRGVSCVPAFTSCLQLQLSCPHCFLGITSPAGSVLSLPLQFCAPHPHCTVQFQTNARGTRQKPSAQGHLSSFHAGESQWAPTTQCRHPSSPSLEFMHGQQPQAFSPVPCSSHGIGIYTS